MYSLAIGELLDATKTSYPETTQLHLSQGHATLTMFLGSPTPQECRDVESGSVELALIDASPHLFILGYRLAAQPWCDSPFEAHRARHELGGFVQSHGRPLPLQVLLVDAGTGILRAWRFLDLSAEFADAMRESVASQLTAPYDPDTTGALLDHLYRSFPRPENLINEFAVARCEVND